MIDEAERRDGAEAARALFEAIAAEDAAACRSVPDESMWPWKRRARRRAMIERAWDVRRAAQSRRFALARLRGAGIGAEPRRWGVFSTATPPYGESVLLEQTLAGHGSVGAALITDVTTARARIALGEDRAPFERRCEAAVLDLAAATTGSARRTLLAHLPGAARPIPDAVAELDRDGRNPLTPMSVTLQEGDVFGRPPRLRLHDIILQGWLRGLGFGTASLQHLCRYADARGLPIAADFIPTLDPGHELAPLARWYYRAGFRVGDAEPDEWRVGSAMLRQPSTTL